MYAKQPAGSHSSAAACVLVSRMASGFGQPTFPRGLSDFQGTRNQEECKTLRKFKDDPSAVGRHANLDAPVED